MNRSLSYYQPVRYDRYMNAFFERVVDAYYHVPEKKRQELGGLLASAIIERGLKEMIHAEQQHLPVEFAQHIDGWVEFISHLTDDYREWRTYGENIFHFQPSLTEMLRYTDVDGLVYERLRFPYKCFYMYWGAASQVSLWDGETFVDGVYVRDEGPNDHPKEPSVWLTFTARRRSADHARKMTEAEFLSHEKCYSLMLGLEEGIRVGSSLENAIRSERESPRYWRELAELWLPYLGDLTRLVMNCLCYLDHEDREVRRRYPEDTPKAMLDKLAKSARPKDIRRNESKLQSMGFRKVFFCGDTLERERPSIATGRELPPHWRRGHWRNQAAGPERKRHKMIWIKPTLVRKDKGDAVIKHIYKTRPVR